MGLEVPDRFDRMPDYDYGPGVCRMLLVHSKIPHGAGSGAS